MVGLRFVFIQRLLAMRDESINSYLYNLVVWGWGNGPGMFSDGARTRTRCWA